MILLLNKKQGISFAEAVNSFFVLFFVPRRRGRRQKGGDWMEQGA